MHNMKKLILGALTLVLLLGATPAVAQLAGTWEGTGTGSCPNPFPTPPESICPWQTWRGEVSEDDQTFSGTWRDYPGSHGTFRGEATLSTPEEVVFVGTWTAIYDDPSGLSVILNMGTFTMHFRYTSRECEGRWWTYDNEHDGTMRGRKVQ